MGGIFGGVGGSGGSSPAATMSVLAQSGAPSSLTGTTTATTLVTVSVPAGTLTAFGSLEIDVQLSWPNNSNNKSFTLAFGGTTVITTTQTANTGMRINQLITNRGVLNQQTSWPSINSYTTTGSNPPTLSVDTSVGQSLTFTVQLGSSADTIRIENYSVRVLNP
jgi:hypothetical protein